MPEVVLKSGHLEWHPFLTSMQPNLEKYRLLLLWWGSFWWHEVSIKLVVKNFKFCGTCFWEHFKHTLLVAMSKLCVYGVAGEWIKSSHPPTPWGDLKFQERTGGMRPHSVLKSGHLEWHPFLTSMQPNLEKYRLLLLWWGSFWWHEVSIKLVWNCILTDTAW